MREGTFK